MKLGPNSTRSQLAMQVRADAADGLSLSPFGRLVDDATNLIFDNLPENSFMGDHSINLVCHYFYGLVNKYQKTRKISKEELLKNNFDEVGALSILRDTSLYNHFTVGEFLRFVPFFPKIQEELINSDFFDICHKLILGITNVQAAKKILENEEQKKSVNLDDLAFLNSLDVLTITFSNVHYEIAEEYLNQITEVENLSRNDLKKIVALASQHVELAFKILNKYGHLYIPEDFTILALRFEIFQHIMN